MATVTERSHANILPYPPLTPDFVSVTMPESGFLSASVISCVPTPAMSISFAGRA